MGKMFLVHMGEGNHGLQPNHSHHHNIIIYQFIVIKLCVILKFYLSIKTIYVKFAELH